MSEPEAPEDLDVASVDWALMTTRSVRRRIDYERPVEPDVIEACVRVAAQAPTGVNRESWRFLVLTEPEPKAALAELYRGALATYTEAAREAAQRAGIEAPLPRAAQGVLAEQLHRMPAIILACILGRPTPDSVAQQVAHYGSVLPAAWSLMVALRARGLGATWTTLHLLHEREAARLLGIPDDVTQTVLLPVGYTRGAKLRPAERKPPAEITYWNAWGRPRA